MTPKEEPKQETLEEVAERYYEENIDQSNIPREHYELEIKELIIGFANKYQQQNYENLKRAFQAGEKYNNLKTFCPNFDEWFEQFKKK